VEPERPGHLDQRSSLAFRWRGECIVAPDDEVGALMPRYLLETRAESGSRLEGAERLAAQRFPEISFERHYVTDDGSTARAIWVCRAPSVAHLGRWAETAELAVTSMCRIAAEYRPV
jgi:hypothetical protein